MNKSSGYWWLKYRINLNCKTALRNHRSMETI